MRSILPSLLVCGLLLSPLAAEAEILAYPEGEPQQLLVGAETDEMDPGEEAYRQYLMQIIQLLQMQIAALLEEQAIAVPEGGNEIRYSTGPTVFENDDLRIEAKQTAVQPYLYDGNDLDDDSMEFAMHLEVTNKNDDEHLLIDRESLVIQPVNADRRPVTPERTFNFKTGHTRTTSEYGYDRNDRKLLAIEPGQTTTVLMYHPYQFSAPGQYRGLVDGIDYTLEFVTYNDETDQFERGGRVYELPPTNELETAPFERVTIMVESEFVDDSYTDDKYDLTEFDAADVPFTFLYPDTLTLDEDDEVWTISHDSNPYIVIGLEDELDLPDSAEEAESSVNTLNYERTLKTTYRFNERDASGMIHEYRSLRDETYTILIYDYSDTSESFDRYDVGEVMVTTFVSKR